MLRVENISKIYKVGDEETRALDGVSLEINKGSFIAITGRSGSGKSTLLYQLSLLDRPTSGEIYFEDILMNKLNDKQQAQLRLEKLGYIFQDYALVPSLTAEENVAFPIMMLGNSFSDARKIAQNSLASVGLEHRFHNLPSQLSGGEQQRVSIARAIAHKPQLIFADEPTANLDSKNAKNILDIFKELHKNGLTIIMITHEKGFTRGATMVLEMLDGKLIN